MRAVTKYHIQKHLMTPVIILVWFICIIPLCIAIPFEWLLSTVVEYSRKRCGKLLDKYNLGVFADVNGKTILKGKSDEV